MLITAIFDSSDSADYALKSLIKAGITYGDCQISSTARKTSSPQIIYDGVYSLVNELSTGAHQTSGTKTHVAVKITKEMESKVHSILVNNGGRQIQITRR